MVDFIIRVLQSSKTWQLRKFWHGLFILMLGGFVVYMCIAFFSRRDAFIDMFSGNISFTYGLFLFGVILTIVQVIVMLVKAHRAHRTITDRDNWVEYIVIVMTPLFGLYGLFVNGFFMGSINDVNHIFFLSLFGLLTVLYPVLKLFGGTMQHRFVRYCGWFTAFALLVLAGMYTLAMFGVTTGEMFLLFPQLLLLLYAAKAYYRETMQGHAWSLLKGLLLFVGAWVVFVYLPNMMPNKLTSFYTKQINKAADLISAGGENAESFMKAKKLMFLERAYLNKFNHQGTTTDTYFTKIFDTTPELYFGDKLKNIATSGNTRATNATKINENAAVELGVMSVDNRIMVGSGSQVPVMKTVYDIYFQNTTTENQEVVINFEAPNDLSVVSDLKLGLDLQFQGQVASRGAARKVYEDSLRINKDPALIEKVGISTYNLRVFPILSKRDERTQGRQRVQITLHTPITADEPISYAPKFSLINTRVDKNSSLVSKVFLNKKLIKEDIIGSEAMDAYLQTAHMLDETITAQIPEQSIFETCIPQMMHNGTLALDILPIFALTTGYQQPLETEKIYVFMDNSASVERNTDTKQRYPQIYTALKNYGDELQDVELYTFNFRVDPVASIDGVQFWGYSDVDSVISFIEKNTIRNSRIIIVTDDDSYNATTTEVKNRKFDTLLSNQLNVIKLGNEIKRYKSDFVSLLSATQGNIYHVDGTGSLDQALNSVFADSRKLIPVCGSGDVVPAPTQETIVMNKIYAGYLASRMMRSVGGVNDRNAIADKQNKLATAFGIVTQFNSMIALENERQQRDLEKYEQQNDKFDSNFNNYSNKQGESTNTRAQQQPTGRERLFDKENVNSNDFAKTQFDSSDSMRFQNNNNAYINPSDTRSADLSVIGTSSSGQQDRFVDVVILMVLALIAFLIVMYGGIKTATSTSNDDKDTAGSIIIKRGLYGIGLIVVAWFIISVGFWAINVMTQGSHYPGQGGYYPQNNQVDTNVFGSLLYLWVWCIVLYHRYLVLVVIGKDIFGSKKEQYDEEGDDWKNESLVQ